MQRFCSRFQPTPGTQVRSTQIERGHTDQTFILGAKKGSVFLSSIFFQDPIAQTGQTENVVFLEQNTKPIPASQFSSCIVLGCESTFLFKFKHLQSKTTIKIGDFAQHTLQESFSTFVFKQRQSVEFS